ncbi:GMP synthase [Thiolinea disciformis]|uniref:GMP synthase n=1 Tax=Thiolinea disciformis TaxID=125614 RepID=UPI0003796A24|nr:GMP synthase [Thiolinea disciformis]
MLVGILETGRPPAELAADYQSYAAMFEHLLGGNNLDFRVFSVLNDEFPEAPNTCDAWLITGSRHGVYEQLPWMLKLQAFIRHVRDAKVPMIGVCFGHQIIAQALGGEVQKSPKGWGIGVHEYAIHQGLPQMGSTDKFRIYAMHQDQVIKRPPDAKIVASSEFCEYAALLYGDSILSFQGHPEFTDHFERELLALRKGTVIPEAQADKTLQEIDSGTVKAEGDKVADWMVGFLKKS